MKLYPILWVAILAVLIVPRVSADASPRPTPSPALLDSARAHLARQVGATFAAKYLTLDTNDTTSIQYFGRTQPETPPTAGTGRVRQLARAVGPDLPVWQFSFRFRDPVKPWIDEFVRVTVDPRGRLTPKLDATGRFLPNAGIDGIGDCARDSTLCEFPINREDAIRIAKQSGLEEGLAPWKVNFNWQSTKDGRFVWVITNTLSDRGICEQSGRMVVIDANSGVVISQLLWNQIC